MNLAPTSFLFAEPLESSVFQRFSDLTSHLSIRPNAMNLRASASPREPIPAMNLQG